MDERYTIKDLADLAGMTVQSARQYIYRYCNDLRETGDIWKVGKRTYLNQKAVDAILEIRNTNVSESVRKKRARNLAVNEDIEDEDVEIYTSANPVMRRSPERILSSDKPKMLRPRKARFEDMPLKDQKAALEYRGKDTDGIIILYNSIIRKYRDEIKKLEGELEEAERREAELIWRIIDNCDSHTCKLLLLSEEQMDEK